MFGEPPVGRGPDGDRWGQPGRHATGMSVSGPICRRIPGRHAGDSTAFPGSNRTTGCSFPDGRASSSPERLRVDPGRQNSRRRFRRRREPSSADEREHSDCRGCERRTSTTRSAPLAAVQMGSGRMAAEGSAISRSWRLSVPVEVVAAQSTDTGRRVRVEHDPVPEGVVVEEAATRTAGRPTGSTGCGARTGRSWMERRARATTRARHERGGGADRESGRRRVGAEPGAPRRHRRASTVAATTANTGERPDGVQGEQRGQHERGQQLEAAEGPEAHGGDHDDHDDGKGHQTAGAAVPERLPLRDGAPGDAADLGGVGPAAGAPHGFTSVPRAAAVMAAPARSHGRTERSRRRSTARPRPTRGDQRHTREGHECRLVQRAKRANRASPHAHHRARVSTRWVNASGDRCGEVRGAARGRSTTKGKVATVPTRAPPWRRTARRRARPADQRRSTRGGDDVQRLQQRHRRPSGRGDQTPRDSTPQSQPLLCHGRSRRRSTRTGRCGGCAVGGRRPTDPSGGVEPRVLELHGVP